MNIKSFNDLGEKVLSAYKEIDPLKIDGILTDENKYINLAISFCLAFETMVETLANPNLVVNNTTNSFEIIKELVRRTFSTFTLANGDIGEGRIEKIAERIINNGINLDDLLGEENRFSLALCILLA